MPEENLLKTWQTLVAFYGRHAEHPFAIDPGNLRRTDDPPDYVSFREATINLLIHQDFGEQTLTPTIRFFRDQSELFNPGDAFVSREQLIDPGEKPVRNPSIVAILRIAGATDRPGEKPVRQPQHCRRVSPHRSVRPSRIGHGRHLRELAPTRNVPPIIDNDKAEKTFRLILPKERLLTEAQLLAQASLGVNLTEQEAAVFAYLTRKGQIDLADVKALTGLNGPGAQRLVQRMTTVQALLVPVTERRHLLTLAEHLRARFLARQRRGGSQKQAVTTPEPHEKD